MGQYNFLAAENERLQRELMLLQEQNALAQNRQRSDKEGNYRSHDKSHDGDSSYSKHKNSIPERFTRKPRRGSRDSRKTISHKTVSLVADEELSGEIERGSEERSTRSYHSEPVQKSKQRVAYYTAYHHPNGGFHVEKGPVKDIVFETQKKRNEPVKRPYKVPPLDLRGITSPSQQVKAFQKHKYSSHENKENMSRPSYDNFANQSHPEWDNIPIIKTQPSFYPQQTQASLQELPNNRSLVETAPLQSASPSRYRGPDILGFHGIVDPNEYTFYKPVKQVEEPHHHRDRKVKAIKSYKPAVKPHLPRQHMEKLNSYDENMNELEENPEQNPMVYQYEPNDTGQDPQEVVVEEPDEEQPDELLYDETQYQVPSDTNPNQQQLPTIQDDDEIEYTPGGSPIMEESDEELSIHLPDDDKDYYQKSYTKY